MFETTYFSLCLETIELRQRSLDVCFFAESSKELEELRGAFSRSLDYMKQDVEESMWTGVRLRFDGFDALG